MNNTAGGEARGEVQCNYPKASLFMMLMKAGAAPSPYKSYADKLQQILAC